MPLPQSEYMSDIWRDGIFTDRVIFATGGSGTIVSALVRALVYLGANACIVGRNVEKTERMAADIATARSGSKVLGIGGVDVRDYKAVEKAVARCGEELGGIDYVIAGAAGNFLASIDQLSANAFKSVIDIDVLGSFNTLKATLPYLLTSASRHNPPPSSSSPSSPPTIAPGGRILFISATLHYTATPFQSHVSAAKAAIDSLSASFALEYGPRGLTSNVIAPGPIGGTEGMERLSRPEDKERGMKSVPVQRWGHVREISDAAVYLLGPGAGFVNGAVLVVDGGAWRVGMQGAPGGGLGYPDFLEGGKVLEGVKGGKRRSKL